jgi:hypothetical protein
MVWAFQPLTRSSLQLRLAPAVYAAIRDFAQRTPDGYVDSPASSQDFVAPRLSAHASGYRDNPCRYGDLLPAKVAAVRVGMSQRNKRIARDSALVAGTGCGTPCTADSP